MDDRPVVVIAAHPDDLDFGCSGTVAKWAKEGKAVYYLICTSGEKGFDQIDLSPQARMEIREGEQRESAKTAGAKEVIYLRYPDGELENTPTLRKSLVRVMRQIKPHTVLTSDPANNRYDNFYRYHPDHRAAAMAAYDAIYPATNNPHCFPELLDQGYLPHHIGEVYFTGPQEPNTWVDISATIDIKIRALACHQSQIGNMEELANYLRERAKECGRPKRMAYAEAFRRLEVPE